MVADCFDHLDRDQLVVVAVEVAIVFEDDFDAAGEASGGDALTGQIVLLARDGGAGDAAAVMGGGVEGETAPAGADFE